MTPLRELSYQDVVRQLRRLGLRFYRSGKGSHELWVRDEDGVVVPVPHHGGKPIRKGTPRAIIRELGLAVDEFMGD